MPTILFCILVLGSFCICICDCRPALCVPILSFLCLVYLAWGAPSQHLSRDHWQPGTWRILPEVKPTALCTLLSISLSLSLSVCVCVCVCAHTWSLWLRQPANRRQTLGSRSVKGAWSYEIAVIGEFCNGLNLETKFNQRNLGLHYSWSSITHPRSIKVSEVRMILITK